MAGGELILGRNRNLGVRHLLPVIMLLLAGSGVAYGQSLYKYRGDNGEWIFTDRQPDVSKVVEVRSLKVAPGKATVTVGHEMIGDTLQVTAKNGLHAPVELALVFNNLSGVRAPHPDRSLRWVLRPRSEEALLILPVLKDATELRIDYEFAYIPGDPKARHAAADGYRVPFAAAKNYRITQAYPDNVTHLSADSVYAIDIAMPIGTDVLAAREGTVFEVISSNYRGGLDWDKHLRAANIVRILHDDGTFALYAHLNWDSIRVRPGDRVRAGQYIADSGNTGFSSGPHLHFAVQQNIGMRIAALPIAFRGPDSNGVVPASGSLLTAYP